MKKLLLMIVAVFAMTLNANAIVLRGTHKLCASEGEELTLYSSGRMVFWDGSRTYQGRYTLSDGYLLLLDENGNQIAAGKYSYNNRTQELNWVKVGGAMLTKC